MRKISKIDKRVKKCSEMKKGTVIQCSKNALYGDLCYIHYKMWTAKDNDERKIQLIESEDEKKQRLLKEELLSQEVLKITTYVFPGKFLPDAKVEIGGTIYKERDYGIYYENHSNMCFYLSVENGDGVKALNLKYRLFVRANELSSKLGANT